MKSESVINSIRCAHCGLKNWLEEGACKRCGRPLGFIEEVSADTEEETNGAVVTVAPDDGAEEMCVCSFCGTRSGAILCPVCRKPLKALPSDAQRARGLPSFLTSSANLLVVAMFVGALVVACVAYVVLRRSVDGALAERAKVTDALRRADAFEAPVYVSFAEESGELQPGVRVLMEKGLVSYRVGTTPRTISYEETDSETGEVVKGEKENPDGGRTYAHVELTARGAAESTGWRRDGGAGWSMPVGTREFVEVKEIGRPRVLAREEWEKLPPEMRASVPQSGEVSLVRFNWRWLPSQFGQYFDAGGEDQRTLSPEAQESARACGLGDAAKVRTGTAALVYEKGEPSVRAVVFEGEGQK